MANESKSLAGSHPGGGKNEGGGYIAAKIDAASNNSGRGTLGTLDGVFFPTVQNITGVLLFIRLPWIAGQAGILTSLAIVLLSISTTIPTALSMSAIATNGRIPAGGPYYVVSRNLGAPFGAAIGFLFYVGTSLAATTYVLGAVEAFQSGFGLQNLFPFDTQVIALCVMFVLAVIVYVGVSWVSRTMYLFLTIVFVSILLGLGGLVAFGSGADFGATGSAVRSTTGPIWLPSFSADAQTGIVPTFQSLVALFYPSVTGIMAGSNRSGLLRNPSASIPAGTLGAIGFTSALYILVIFLFGSLVAVETLKLDKLVFATVAWPVQEVVTAGIIASSIGAGMQSLVGAPQLLATMLADDVLPFVPYIRFCCSSLPRRCAASCCCRPSTDPHGSVMGYQHGSASRSGSGSGVAVGADHADRDALSSAVEQPSGRAHPAIDERFEDRFGTADDVAAADVQYQRRFRSTQQSTDSGQQMAEAAARQEQDDGEAGDDDDDNDDDNSNSSPRPSPSAAAAVASGLDDDEDDNEDDDEADSPGQLSPVAAFRSATARGDGKEDASADGASSAGPPVPRNAAPSGRGVAGFKEVAITWLLASLPCLAGNLDFITPIQTEAFLVMYLCINLAAFLNSFFYTPSFRPTWRVHWAVHGLGVVTCLAVMLVVQWWQALLALGIAALLHTWVRAGEQDDEWGTWGSSFASITFGQATRALLDLRDLPGSASTWRPQLLVLASTTASGEPTRPELVRLAGQLKNGKGVTMVTSVRTERLVSLLNRIREERRRARVHGGAAGDEDRRPPIEVAVGDPQRNLRRYMDTCGCEGFAQLVVSPDLFPALETAVQTSGLSALRPNAVVVGWPRRWRRDMRRAREFVLLCKSVLRLRKSLVAVKFDEGVSLPPVARGTIDLYWMGSDSGLILLLPYLLQRHPYWRACKLRLFAVDPALAGRQAAVQAYLAAMRIPASVFIVPVEATVIDEALEGRTLTQDAAEELQRQLAVEMGTPQQQQHGGDGGGSGGGREWPWGRRPPSPAAAAAAAAGVASPASAASAAGQPPPMSSSMTMVLGQPSQARRNTRRSVMDVFGAQASPSSSSSAARDASEVELTEPKAASSSHTTTTTTATTASAAAAPSSSLPSVPEASEDGSNDGKATVTNSGSTAVTGAASAMPVTPVRPAVVAAGGPMSSADDGDDEEDGDDGTSSFVRSARRMNELIREHSSGAALVVASLMLTRERDPEEVMAYTEAFCAGIPRAVLVRGTGQEVLTAVA